MTPTILDPRSKAIVASRLPKNEGKTLQDLKWKPKAGLTSISRLTKPFKLRHMARLFED